MSTKLATQPEQPALGLRPEPEVVPPQPIARPPPPSPPVVPAQAEERGGGAEDQDAVRAEDPSHLRHRAVGIAASSVAPGAYCVSVAHKSQPTVFWKLDSDLGSPQKVGTGGVTDCP